VLALASAPQGRWWARSGAIEGLAPIETVGGVTWTEDRVIATGRLVGAEVEP
jgi:hypothetical protein